MMLWFVLAVLTAVPVMADGSQCGAGRSGCPVRVPRLPAEDGARRQAPLRSVRGDVLMEEGP